MDLVKSFISSVIIERSINITKLPTWKYNRLAQGPHVILLVWHSQPFTKRGSIWRQGHIGLMQLTKSCRPQKCLQAPPFHLTPIPCELIITSKFLEAARNSALKRYMTRASIWKVISTTSTYHNSHFAIFTPLIHDQV